MKNEEEIKIRKETLIDIEKDSGNNETGIRCNAGIKTLKWVLGY